MRYFVLHVAGHSFIRGPGGWTRHKDQSPANVRKDTKARIVRVKAGDNGR